MRKQIVFLAFLVVACLVFLLPGYWAVTKSPWYLTLFLVSWIPSLFIGSVGALFYNNGR